MKAETIIIKDFDEIVNELIEVLSGLEDFFDQRIGNCQLPHADWESENKNSPLPNVH